MGASSADTISFLVKLEEQIAGPSTKAEKALQSLNSKITSSEQAIAGLEKKLTSAKEKLDKIAAGGKGGAVDIAAYKKQASIVEELGGKLGKAKSDHAQLTGAVDKYKAAAEKSRDATDGLSGKLDGAKEKLAAVRSSAYVVAAVFVASLAAAAFVAANAFRNMAVRIVDARRSFLLSIQAAAGSATSAKELGDQVDRAASKYPLATDHIKSMARALALAKVSGKTAGDALQAVGLVAVTAGEESANRLRELVNKSAAAGHLVNPLEALAGSGVSADELYAQLSEQIGVGTKEIEAKLKAGKIGVEDGVAALNRALQNRLGGVGDSIGLGLESQLAKASNDFKALFKGVNIDPMLKALRSVFELLDQSTASGRALRALLGGAAQGLVDSTTKAAPSIKAFFQQIIIMGLKAGIAMKPRLREWFGVGDVIGGEMTKGAAGASNLKQTLDAILAVMNGIGTAAGVVKDVVGIFIRPKSIDIAKGVSQDNTKAVAFGAQLALGIQKGVEENAAAPIGSITKLARAMQNAFTTTQQIHSPSRVFARFTGYITDAIVGRAEADQPRVQQSINALVETPPKPSADGSSSRGGNVYHVQIIQNFSGGASEETRRDARDGVFDAFDDIADAMGAPA